MEKQKEFLKPCHRTPLSPVTQTITYQVVYTSEVLAHLWAVATFEVQEKMVTMLNYIVKNIHKENTLI
jgi:hypothetical protein